MKPLKITQILILGLISSSTLAQIPHEHPDHPKGNSATMYQALPFYNEACELYKNDEIKRAKSSLYEAINISFPLTEAQLFLADILYEEGLRDSALYFYKSGIDFAIEQRPYYYFRLFELGIEQGQYHIVKHNLKYFHKLYGSKGYEAPYENDFPYDRSDYEFYEDALELLYDYTSWKPFAEQIESYNWVVKSNGQKEYRYLKGSLEIQKKPTKNKWKQIKDINDDMNDFYLRSDNTIVFTQENESKILIYLGKLNGNKLTEIKKLPDSINTSHWNSTPFLSSENILYYAIEENENKEIVAAEIDNEGNIIGEIFKLNRINTSGNEFAPFFDEHLKIFYFSSDARPGFGRYDMYQCMDYEIINKFINPFNERNCGATINTNLNNISVFSLNSIIYSTSVDKKNVLRTKKLQRHDGEFFNYDLRRIERNETEN